MSDNNTKTFYADAGKGDRPLGTGWKNYYANWDNIFGKKDAQAQEENPVAAVSSEGQEPAVG